MSGVVPSEKLRLWRVGTLTYTTGGLVLLFAWLLWGDFAFSMRERTIPGTVQLLFKTFGASDTLVGILFASLPAAIGLILGPVVGYRSDRLRTRWGRRIPFLAIPTPFIVLSMAGMAFAPQIGAALHRTAGGLSSDGSILLCLAVFWGVFEIACITANSIFYALINDVVPQEVIGRFFGVFRATGLLAAIGVNYSVMGKAETHYVPIFLGIGALYGVGFLVMCLRVKEGAYPPPPQPLPGEQGRLAAIRSYFRDGFSKPYYLWYFAFSLLVIQATVPYNLYSVFYAKSIGLDLTTYFRCYAWIYGVSLCLAYPLGALVDRFHPLRVGLVVAACYALVMVGGLFVHDIPSFLAIQVAHGVLSGTLFTTVLSLPQRLLPRAKFAELYSVGGVLNSLFSMALAPILGEVLDHTGHAYRYVFHAGLILSGASLFTGVVLYRKFVALGGPSNYQAPE